MNLPVKKPQHLDIDGKRYLLVPEQDWLAVLGELEDLDDALTGERALTRWEKAGRPVIRLEAANAARNGENPIKAAREAAKLTQSQLAQKTGLSTLYISQLETGRRKGSVKAVKAISRALDTDAGFLLGE